MTAVLTHVALTTGRFESDRCSTAVLIRAMYAAGFHEARVP